MTNLRQAAEMALKFMEDTHHTALTTYPTEGYDRHCFVEKSLRQALDQSPDTTKMIEPISEFECPRCGHCCKQVEEPPVTNAEPVAWISDSPTKGNGKQLHWTKAQALKWSSNITPLYAAPLKPDLLNQVCCECGNSGGYALYCVDCWSKANQWVGLTEEEIFEDEWWDEQTAYAVNKMLMERNK